MKFTKFETWKQVLDAAAADPGEIYYKPPLNYYAVRMKSIEVQGEVLRMTPYDNEADPFDADESHLERFQRRA